MDLDANSCNFFLFVRPVLKRFIFSVPYILFICLKIPLFSIKLLVFPFWRLSKTAWTFCILGKCSTVIMINTEAKSALLFVMVILSCPPPLHFVQKSNNCCVVRFFVNINVLFVFGQWLNCKLYCLQFQFIDVQFFFSEGSRVPPSFMLWVILSVSILFLMQIFLSLSPHLRTFEFVFHFNALVAVATDLYSLWKSFCLHHLNLPHIQWD